MTRRTRKRLRRWSQRPQTKTSRAALNASRSGVALSAERLVTSRCPSIARDPRPPARAPLRSERAPRAARRMCTSVSGALPRERSRARSHRDSARWATDRVHRDRQRTGHRRPNCARPTSTAG